MEVSGGDEAVSGVGLSVTFEGTVHHKRAA